MHNAVRAKALSARSTAGEHRTAAAEDAGTNKAMHVLSAHENRWGKYKGSLAQIGLDARGCRCGSGGGGYSPSDTRIGREIQNCFSPERNLCSGCGIVGTSL